MFAIQQLFVSKSERLHPPTALVTWHLRQITHETLSHFGCHSLYFSFAIPQPVSFYLLMSFRYFLLFRFLLLFIHCPSYLLVLYFLTAFFSPAAGVNDHSFLIFLLECDSCLHSMIMKAAKDEEISLWVIALLSWPGSFFLPFPFHRFFFYFTHNVFTFFI